MEVNNLVFSYDDVRDQLKDVTVKIEKHKVTTIIGPNGCGKSTLLSLMSRNYTPRAGTIILDGKEISTYKAKEFAKKLAVVHQQNEAPADMSVEHLVSFGRLPHKSMFKRANEEDEKAIEWALERTKLQSKRKVLISELSGGEKQRVWIAMMLAQNTPILFLDEPTTFLDMYYQIEILDLVRQLNESHGMTIVMVLHDINQAIRYSDSIIIMKDGEMKMKGEPTDVITADTMKEIYGVDVVVKEDEEAGLYLVPMGI